LEIFKTALWITAIEAQLLCAGALRGCLDGTERCVSVFLVFFLLLPGKPLVIILHNIDQLWCAHVVNNQQEVLFQNPKNCWHDHGWSGDAKFSRIIVMDPSFTYVKKKITWISINQGQIGLSGDMFLSLPFLVTTCWYFFHFILQNFFHSTYRKATFFRYKFDSNSSIYVLHIW
jgi:hypothetical protein